jgi:ABC-type ATPase with predicted acetyltransferase domain
MRATTTVKLEWEAPTAVAASDRVLEIAGMFGLGVDERKTLQVVVATDLELRGGEVVYVTGPSGGGKSTILRLIKEQHGNCATFDDVFDFDFDRPVIDQVGSTLAEAAQLLALAGLADAFVMLRKPGELSDGQRYRLGLARLMERASQVDELALLVILADEFGATLDRLTADVVARNIRKWVRGQDHVCFVAATTHEDLLGALEPDVLVYKGLGEEIEMHRGADADESAGGA